jgi:hypothetical protein
MMDNINDVTDVRLKALKEIEKDKARVARAYNKKVKSKSFQVGELVWKTILHIRSKSNQFGKWSPNWESPYKVIKVIYGNSYLLETLQGEWPMYTSPLEQKWPMYTSPLVTMQPMRWVSLMFDLIMFV